VHEDLELGKLLNSYFSRRISALLLYAKRILLWNATLPKFITGDFFAREADFVYRPSRFRWVDRLSNNPRKASVVFCPSHYLEDFLREFGSDLRAHTLILGNSDRDFYTFDFNIPNSIERIFVQNLNCKNELLHLLPIGLENMRLGRNICPIFDRDSHKSSLILSGPFSNTHIEREQIAAMDFAKLPFRVVNSYDGIRNYQRIISTHRFTLCPRGNGMDTHRFWEVAYSGGVPVVKRSIWSEILQSEGFPLVIVEEWNAVEVARSIEEFQTFNSPAIEHFYLDKRFWKKKLRDY